jgi:hypothetical protein
VIHLFVHVEEVARRISEFGLNVCHSRSNTSLCRPFSPSIHEVPRSWA